MANHAIFWLNSFPHPDGISETLSPWTIITSQTIDYNHHCRYKYGEYVQTHDQHDNTMAPRTIGTLTMWPTSNTQGNFYFFSLSTGHIINRSHATKLPMPAHVIDRVHIFAWRQKAAPSLLFLDHNRAPDNATLDAEDSDSDDSDYEPSGDGMDYDSDD